MDDRSQRRVLAEGRFARLVAQNGWEWAERVNTTGAVIIVAVTTERQLVLVEQFRIPLGCRAIELPAGLVGDVCGSETESRAEAARRELLEETGYEAATMEFLVSGPSSPGLVNELYTLFLARDARRVARGGGDASEQIHVHLVRLDEADAWLERKRSDGVAVDPRVYAGLYFAASR
jgi:ADP-ribose pyrophosphatase